MDYSVIKYYEYKYLKNDKKSQYFMIKEGIHIACNEIYIRIAV